jgi:hypothetical protein
MQFSPEVLFGVGIVILVGAFAWALIRKANRNRANDRIAEQATHELYEHPETYPERREELKKEVRPS